MKMTYFKSGLFSAAIAIACAAGFSSCAEDINVGGRIDENPFETVKENNVFLRDVNSNAASTVVELFNGGYTTAIKLGLTKAPQSAVSVKLAVDAEYLAKYNQEHGTDFLLYPAESVTFENDGVLTVGAKAYFSEQLAVTFAAAEGLVDNATYALPVVITEHSGDITLKEESKRCMYLVKYMANEPDCFKGEDLPKGLLYFEVNDANPLNALAFQLENGKYLWDVVVLFSANINYNPSTGRPFLNCNPNVQFLLDNNEQFLQPLRKRGIKVLLCVLGNHDQAGVAQLSETGARDFARELAEVCRAYNLDGVNFDDEYSTSPDLSNPAFAPRSQAAGARLCYETKQAMPEKMVTVYDYGNMYGVASVDGVDVDNWIDIAVADYPTTTSPIGAMSWKKCSGASMEFNRGGGNNLTPSRAQAILDRGWGWFMGFALNPLTNFDFAYRRITGCETLYGSKLKYPTIYYKKNDTTPYPFE